VGYFLGGGTAYLLKQDWRDIVAIGVETGVQNTGLAILALRISLPEPESDLTTGMPFAVCLTVALLF
jgi:sodium/bile acid cotransporter 3/5